MATEQTEERAGVASLLTGVKKLGGARWGRVALMALAVVALLVCAALLGSALAGGFDLLLPVGLVLMVAITGALVSVGAVVYGVSNVKWATVGQKVVIPLLLSPFLALRLIRAASAPRLMNSLHWLSSGTASFARGLNDTPKIVALGVAFYFITQRAASYQTPFWLFALVALAMGVGSVIGGRAVTTTLAEKVTRMDYTEGFAANLATAALVAGASNLGLPVSTTHVSSGAIIGIGLREGAGRAQWGMVRGMALAWVVTLPAAGALAIVAYELLALVHGGS